MERYQLEQQKWRDIQIFVTKFRNSVNKLKVDESKSNPPRYVNSFSLHKDVNKLVTELQQLCEAKGINQDKRLEEMRLVLPSVPDHLSIPPLLSHFGEESRHPRRSCTHNFPFDYRMDCFMITLRNQFVYTESNIPEGITRLMTVTINEGCDDEKRQMFQIPKGRYCIVKTKNDEVIALRDNLDDTFEILYFPTLQWIKMEDNRSHTSLYKSRHPLSCIAVTHDNNIFVCVDEGKDYKKNMSDMVARSYFMVFTLQGKCIKESQNILKSPKHVAISDQGEIAISDPAGYCVVILNADFEEIKRLEYFLPTSMTSSVLNSYPTFEPKGLCYDKFGRIIVADAANHSIVRFCNNGTNTYRMEPLIVHRQDLEDFVNPYLVGLGPEEKLWVACKNKVFAFDYHCLS